MIETNRVAIVRYIYSKASGPKLGALFPKRSRKGPDVCVMNNIRLFYIFKMMIYIQLAFYEDVRDFYLDFEPFSESTKPDGILALIFILLYSILLQYINWKQLIN